MVTIRGISRDGNTSYSNAKKEFLTISDEKNKSEVSGGQYSDENQSELINSDQLLS